MKILMGEALRYDSIIHVGSHHYADQFVAHGHSVFWLGSTLHAGNLIKAAFGRTEDHRLVKAWRQGSITISERFRTYHPLTLLPYRNLPVMRSRFVLDRMLSLTLPTTRSVLAQEGFERPDLLWLSQSPVSIWLLRHTDAKKVAYRLSDSYTHFREIPESIRSAEEEIIRRADVVFATAHRIVTETKPLAGDKLHYLPNGVDYDHFHSERPEPDDITHLRSPRAVYVGSLREWFDTDLLAYCARQLPKVSFLLIGPVRTDLSLLAGLPNVSILGARQYADIPAYLRHSDVAIIPFRRTPLTDATNPVKLFEFFAAGLPVVSVRLNEIECLNSPAYLADDPETFVMAIQTALSAGRNLATYDHFARENSWSARYDIIRQALSFPMEFGE